MLAVGGDTIISGKLGVGTTNPTNALDVVGDTIISGNLGVGTTNPTNALDVVGDTIISGNLGVGTTSPSSLLTVNNKPFWVGSFDHSDTPLSVNYNAVPTSASNLNDPKSVMHLTREGTGGESYAARATFKLSRYEANFADSRSRLDIVLADGEYADSDVMTMRSNGDVAINGSLDVGSVLHLTSGTTTYNTADVNASELTNTYISFKEAGSSNDWAYLRQIGGTNAYHMALDFHDDADDAQFSIRTVASAGDDSITTRFTIVRDGKVGIGTTNPTETLEIVGGNVKIPMDKYYLGGNGVIQERRYNYAVKTTFTGNEKYLFPFNLTITTKQSNATVILNYVINAEIMQDNVFKVRRSDGSFAGTETYDIQGAGLAGIASPGYDQDLNSTMTNTVVEIVDNVSGNAGQTITYNLYCEGTYDTFALNRTLNTATPDGLEGYRETGISTYGYKEISFF
jgi:hypothetical protein